MVVASEDERKLVRSALESPKFKWRTIRGIAAETSVEEETVQRALEELGDEVVQSSTPSRNNQQLFTTRKHYRATATIASRIAAALLNRV